MLCSPTRAVCSESLFVSSVGVPPPTASNTPQSALPDPKFPPLPPLSVQAPRRQWRAASPLSWTRWAAERGSPMQ